tara:strand:- start:89 stop:298 length:210 start_codon:yes stop_codon:yes gene_type:complete
MFKKGFKAAHFMTSHKVGTVVDIIYEKNNQLTIGGTTSSVVWIVLEFNDKNKQKFKEKYRSGDLIRIFD